MLNIDEILLELSYKTDTGIIDLTKQKQVEELSKLLRKNGIKNSNKIAAIAKLNYGLLKEASDSPNASNVLKMKATPFEAFIAALMTDLPNGKITNPNRKVNGVKLGDGQVLFDALKKISGIKSGEYSQFEGKPTTSKLWAEWTGKASDTAKTDIQGPMAISLKRGASQLISPKKKELIATFQAAGEVTGVTKKMKEEIKNDIEELKKITEKFVTDGKTDQGLDVTQLKKIATDREKYNQKQKEKGEKPFKARLSAQNNKALELIEKVNKYHKKMEKKLNSMVQNDPMFIKAMIFEAGSGEVKFAGGTGRAEWLLAVSGDITKAKLLNMANVNSEAINYLTGKVSFAVSMKTTGYGPEGNRDGYNFYSSLRIAIEDIKDKSQKLEEAINLFSAKKHLLTEGVLDDFLSRIKKGWDWIIDKLKNLWNWIVEVSKKALDLIESGLEGICKVLGIEPDIQANTDFEAL